MGRQIRFFMLNNDENKFLKIVEDLGDTIVDDKSAPINLDRLKEFPIYKKDEIYLPPLTQFFIISPESNLLKDNNGFINQIRSDVIEFSRCSITDKNMVWEGRIWAEFKYYDDDGKIIKKDKWFEQNFNKYRNWIKKNLKISVDKDSYIGEEALILYKEMGYRMMNSPKVEIKF